MSPFLQVFPRFPATLFLSRYGKCHMMKASGQSSEQSREEMVSRELGG